METPTSIASLFTPNGKKAPAVKRVWGIDLATVWLPFFTATNTQGVTAIPSDALGCPMRLKYNADGSVKFTKTGRPVFPVEKEIANNVRLVKENFTAGLLVFAEQVLENNAEGYQAQVEMARVAGEPIMIRDRANLAVAQEKQRAEALAEAQAEAERIAHPLSHRGKKTEAPAEAELVTA
ncbi:hypothetical protein ES705_31709 [subsurface metagenome]